MESPSLTLEKCFKIISNLTYDEFDVIKNRSSIVKLDKDILKTFGAPCPLSKHDKKLLFETLIIPLSVCTILILAVWLILYSS